MIGYTNAAVGGNQSADSQLTVTTEGNSTSHPTTTTPASIQASGSGVTMTKYTLSYFPPSNPQTGELWVALSTSPSDLSFNTINTNQIIVNAYAGRIWNGSAWVRCPNYYVKVNGTWQQPKTIYDWGAYVDPSTVADFKSIIQNNDSTFSGKVDYQTNSIRLAAATVYTDSELYSNADINARNAAIVVNKGFPLSQYKYICITGNGHYRQENTIEANATGGFVRATFGTVATSAIWSQTAYPIVSADITANSQLELIIPTGGAINNTNYYIGIDCRKVYGSYSVWFDITNIRLEK